MKAFFSMLGFWRTGALACCAVLAAMAYILKFQMLGYSFSALMCVLVILLILFYTFFPLLGGVWPKFTKLTLRIVSVILILALLVVGVTEAVIIKASLGNPEEHIEYMVVLGAKVRSDGPSVALWERIYAARNYLLAHPHVTAVVSGGQGPDEPMTEAQCMYDALISMGIKPERIWLEDKATSTWENLNFSLELIEEKTGIRPEKIGVVSSEYHLFRASLFTKACNAEFVGIPARTARFSQKINHFLREVAGVWHYLILGGQYD